MRFSAFTGPWSSIGLPTMFRMRPSVALPTGIMMGLPVSVTSMPRTRPSDASIATARTTDSPRCCATSRTRLSFSEERLGFVTVRAFRIVGSLPWGNSTSTTGPMTWMILPFSPALTRSCSCPSGASDARGVYHEGLALPTPRAFLCSSGRSLVDWAGRRRRQEDRPARSTSPTPRRDREKEVDEACLGLLGVARGARGVRHIRSTTDVGAGEGARDEGFHLANHPALLGRIGIDEHGASQRGAARRHADIERARLGDALERCGNVQDAGDEHVVRRKIEPRALEGLVVAPAPRAALPKRAAEVAFDS